MCGPLCVNPETPNHEMVASLMVKLFSYLSCYVIDFAKDSWLSLLYICFGETFSRSRSAWQSFGYATISLIVFFRQVFIDRDYDTSGWQQDAWLKRGWSRRSIDHCKPRQRLIDRW